MKLSTPVLKRLLLPLLLVAAAMPATASGTAAPAAKDLQVLERPGFSIVHSLQGEAAARQLLRSLPEVKRSLENLFGWPISFHATILLVDDGDRFRRLAGHPAYVAYAVPDRQLMVIDTSRLISQPHTLEVGVKHELCHLLLHARIDSVRLPQWLDEGVCQWASDGFAEVMGAPGPSPLVRAAAAGRLIPFSRLVRRFPAETEALRLAYEQSHSLVDFISRRHGKDRLLALLNRLARGEPFESAMADVLSATPLELEQNWRRQLQGRTRWWTVVAANIYGMLFFLAAVLTVIGFVLRRIHKGRRFRFEEEPEGEDSVE
jgi:hypothetical protein